MAWFRTTRQRCALRTDNRQKSRSLSPFCFETLEDRLVMDADDFGNDMGSATAVQVVFPYPSQPQGEIEVDGDLDFFQFTAAFTGKLTILQQAQPFISQLDSYLQVLDSSGTVIAANDNHGDSGVVSFDVGAQGVSIGGPSATDSEVQLQVTAGQTYYVVAGGASGSTGAYNLTFELRPQIHGVVFDDVNGDGAQDPGEVGLADRKVFLDSDRNGQWDPQETFTLTDSNGAYSFTELLPGTYVVGVEQTPDVKLTTDGDRLFALRIDGISGPRIDEIDPSSGDVLTTFPMPATLGSAGPQGLAVGPSSLFYVDGSGVTGPITIYELDLTTGVLQDSDLLPGVGSISGVAYLDGLVYLQEHETNRIHVWNPSTDTIERTLQIPHDIIGGLTGAGDRGTLFASNGAGQLIEIDPNTGAVLAVTHPSVGELTGGLAYLGGLIYAANYSSSFPTTGYRIDPDSGSVVNTFVIAGQGPLPALGGDGAPGGSVVTLTNYQIVTGMALGLQSTLGEIHGVAFDDINGDGVQDPSESILANWKVFLDTDRDGIHDAGEIDTFTDSNGAYSFTGLLPGTYFVGIETPADRRLTTGTDRLFALRFNSPSDVRIDEIDKTSGSIINSFGLPAPLSTAGPQGLAVGRESLFYLSGASGPYTLYELDLETGAVLDADVLVGVSVTSGLAYLNGLVYLLEHGADKIKIWDPASDALVGTLTIPWDIIGGLTGAADRGTLFAAGGSGQLLEIDPATGSILNNYSLGVGALAGGLAYVDGMIIGTRLGDSTSTAFRIDPNTGAVLDTFFVAGGTGTGSLPALGGDGAPGAMIIQLGETQVLTGVDLGLQSTRGEIHGVAFDDLNGDGVQDPGESALANWKVFLDTDRDGVHDAGEIDTLTDNNGAYSFTELLPGTYVVGIETPVDRRLTTGTDRLFALRFNSSSDVRIDEIDKTSGSIINSFGLPAPLSTAGPQGLAVGRESLFYLSGASGPYTLYELDLETGAVLDADVLVGVSVTSGLAYLNGLVYLLEHGADKIKIWDPAKDALVGTLTVPWDIIGGLTGAADRGTLFAAGSSGQLLEIDPATGSILTNHSLGVGALAGGLAYIDGMIIGTRLGDSTSTAFRIDPNTGVVLNTFFVAGGTGTGSLPALGGDGAPGAMIIQLGETQVLSGVDLGLQSTRGEIHGVAFDDLNGDGVQEPGESALANWKVFLDTDRDHVWDAGETFTFTDSNGAYSFAGLLPGTYVVGIETPADRRLTTGTDRLFAFRFTSPSDAHIDEVDPTSGAILNSFGLPASITTPGPQGLAIGSESLFYFDASTIPYTLYELNLETGAIIDSDVVVGIGTVSGVAYLDGLVYLLEHSSYRIHVYDPSLDGIVETFTLPMAIVGGLTGAADRGTLFAFSPSGDIIEIDPSNGTILGINYPGLGSLSGGLAYVDGELIAVRLNDPNSTAFRIDPDTGTVISNFFVGGAAGFLPGLAGDGAPGATIVQLGETQILSGVDFGLQSILGEIHGVAFDDIDGDGVQDAGEFGLANRKVFLDSDRDGVWDPSELYTTTDGAGAYSFTGLMPGNYAVTVEPGLDKRLTTGSGRLFSLRFVSPSDARIDELDPNTGIVLNSFLPPVAVNAPGPQGLAVGPSCLYYLDGFNGPNFTIYELDPQSDAVLDSDIITGIGSVSGLAYLGGLVYLLEHGSDRIHTWDPMSDTLLATVAVPHDLVGGLTAAPDRGTLFASNGAGEIIEIDPSNGLVLNVLQSGLGSLTGGLAYANGLIIATSNSGTSSAGYRIDPDTGAIVDQFTLGGGPGFIPGFGGEDASRAVFVRLGASETVSDADLGLTSVVDVGNDLPSAEQTALTATGDLLLQGVIEEADDVDVYRFVATVSGLAFVTLNHPGQSNGESSSIQVYSGAGDFINDADTFTPFTLGTRFLVTAGQTYYVRVESDDPGAYLLSVDTQTNISDVGNDIATAAPLAYNGTAPASQAGVIDAGYDRDMFRFTAAVSGYVTIEQLGFNDFDPYLYVYDSTGQLIDSDDDGGVGGIGLNSRLTISVVAGQTYYIAAAGFANDYGAYELRLSAVDDFANQIAGAAPLTLTNGQGARTGRIETAGDLDFFSFTLASGAFVTFDLMATGSLNPYLSLYDASGNLLSFDDDSGPGINSRIARNLVAGQYYLAASGVGSSVGTYQLQASVAIPVVDDFGNDFLGAQLVNLPLSGSTSLTGRIEVGGDVDMFRFTANFNGVILVTQSATPGSAVDSSLAAYASDGSLIVANDDYGGTVHSQLAIRVSAGQSYFVRSSAFGTTKGQYALTFQQIVDDFGDTFAEAQTIALNPVGETGQGGSIERIGDVDYFVIDASATGRMTIRMIGTGGFDSALTVYDSQQTQIGFNDDNPLSPGTLDSRLTFDVVNGERYYIRASAFGNSVGAYVLAIATTTSVDDFGNNFSQATWVTLDSDGAGAQSGVIDAAGDFDFFIFTATVSGTITVNQTTTSGNLDGLLTLYNWSHVRTASNDNAGPTTTDSAASFTVIAGKTYYIRAGAVDPADDSRNTGSYQLTISTVEEVIAPPPAVDETVGNAVADRLREIISDILSTVSDPQQAMTLITQALAQEFVAANGQLSTDYLLFWSDPVDFVLTNEQGQQVGFTQDGGQVDEVGGSFHSGNGFSEVLIVPTSSASQYSLELVGVGQGGFRIGATVISASGAASNPFVIQGELGKGNLVAVLDFRSPTDTPSGGDDGVSSPIAGTSGGGNSGSSSSTLLFGLGLFGNSLSAVASAATLAGSTIAAGQNGTIDSASGESSRGENGYRRSGDSSLLMLQNAIETVHYYVETLDRDFAGKVDSLIDGIFERLGIERGGESTLSWGRLIEDLIPLYAPRAAASFQLIKLLGSAPAGKPAVDQTSVPAESSDRVDLSLSEAVESFDAQWAIDTVTDLEPFDADLFFEQASATDAWSSGEFASTMLASAVVFTTLGRAGSKEKKKSRLLKFLD